MAQKGAFSLKKKKNTFVFGLTVEPFGSASAVREDPAANFDDMANEDPNTPVQCPYDKSHIIRASRFPYHLLKCRKNHPELAAELKACPYNARHLIPKHEVRRHMETCRDRRAVPLESGGDTSDSNRKWQAPVGMWVNPNMTEDWEEETDEGAAPFVWGKDTAVLPRLPGNF